MHWLESIDMISMIRLKDKSIGPCHPLSSWDVSGMFLQTPKFNSSKIEDLRMLTALSKELGWMVNIENMLSRTYDAIVLTDEHQIINWVNNGFEPMTGYSPEYAIGKSPKFLQGKETYRIDLDRIKKKIKSSMPFSDRVTNYKKNGNLYSCEISIIPLMNAESDISHYIALEKELVWKNNKTYKH